MSAAQNRGAKVLGNLLGFGSSYDVSRGQNERNAVERCAGTIEAALADACIGEVDCIFCSANGSSREDRVEAIALNRVFGTRSIPISSVCGALGENLGASGMIQVIQFLESARSGRVPGIHGVTSDFGDDLPALAVSETSVEGEFKTGLLLSLGFDGSSAAVVLSAP